MDKDLDLKLYGDYLNGETKAFEILYLKYKNKIKYFIYNIVKDSDKAEDITQEVFIYILKSKIKDEYSFKYYIYLIAKSRAINYLNTEKRRTEINDMYIAIDNLRNEEDVSEIITKQEQQEELIKAINLLDEKYKNAIFLVKLEGLSYKETAEILNISIQNVKNLIHRGKKELRKILVKKGFEEMNKISKIVVIVICVSVILSGIVYATTYYIKNVWQEPEKYNWKEEMKVTLEDENNAITENEIERIIDEKLKWLGYEKAEIINKELVKNPENKKINWKISLNNKMNFTLNAITGDLVQFIDLSFNDLEIKSTTKEADAKKIAKELYSKLGYNESEYEIASLKKSGIDIDGALWTVDFCKKYDNVYNFYQCIRISFVPEIKRIKILTVFDEEYEDNPVMISENEAKEIAKQKALELNKSEDKLKSITAKLEIKKMNTQWYSPNDNATNNIAEDTTKTQNVDTNTETYRVPETIIRKVWNVELDYSGEFAEINSYYVDATTGEIIGGGST